MFLLVWMVLAVKTTAWTTILSNNNLDVSLDTLISVCVCSATSGTRLLSPYLHNSDLWLTRIRALRFPAIPLQFGSLQQLDHPLKRNWKDPGWHQVFRDRPTGIFYDSSSHEHIPRTTITNSDGPELLKIKQWRELHLTFYRDLSLLHI